MALDDSKLDGMYRALVVDDADPELRNRYRVHVYGVHTFYSPAISDLNDYGVEKGKSIPAPLQFNSFEVRRMQGGGSLMPDYWGWKGTSGAVGTSGGGGSSSAGDPRNRFRHYPWAEVISQGSKLTGHFVAFRPGDLVWVVFEGGNHNYPVIVGGWISRSGGLNDIYPEIAMDYKNRQRDVYGVRYGQLLEFSMMHDEDFVGIAAGPARIRCYHPDMGIEVVTPTTFWMEARKAMFAVPDGFHVVTAEFSVEVPRVLGIGYNMCAIKGFSWIQLYALYNVNIGQIVETAAAGGKSYQSNVVVIGSKNILIGTVCPSHNFAYGVTTGLGAGNPKIKSTCAIGIHALKYIIVTAGRPASSGGVGGGGISISSDHAVYIYSDVSVTLAAPAIAIDGTTSVTVATPSFVHP